MDATGHITREYWNTVCDKLEVLSSAIHPVLYGCRLLLINQQGRGKEIKLYELIIQCALGLISFSRRRARSTQLSSLNVVVVTSLSKAVKDQLQCLCNDEARDAGNYTFLVSPLIFKDFCLQFEGRVDHSRIVNLGVCCFANLNIIKNCIDVYKWTIRLRNEFDLNNGFNFKNIYSFLFHDLLAYNCARTIFINGGYPKLVLGYSDMTSIGNGIHAISNELLIPNYIVQHGALGLLQTRHNKGTKIILWGKAHKRYYQSVCDDRAEIFIANTIGYRLDEKVNSTLESPYGVLFFSNGRYDGTKLLPQSYIDATYNGLTALAKRLNIPVYVYPHPSERMKVFIDKMEAYGLNAISEKKTREELINLANVFLSNYSTATLEMYVHNVYSYFWSPVDYLSDSDIFFSIAEGGSTLLSDNDLVAKIRELMMDPKSRLARIRFQQDYFQQIFAKNELRLFK